MEANLYLDKIDVCRYWPENAPVSCEDFLAKLKSGGAKIEDFKFLSPRDMKAFRMVLDPETYLPEIPMLTNPRPTSAGLMPVNEPDAHSMVIVTTNNEHTVELLLTLWAQSLTPAYFLVVDCKGSTVDMAIVFGDFTPERLKQAVDESGLEGVVEHRRMIIPGVSGGLKEEFAHATGWAIEIGPFSAIELPLFLGERWIFPD